MNFLLKFFVMSLSAKRASKKAMSLFVAVIQKLEASNAEATKVIDRNEAKISKLEYEKEEMSELIVQNTVVVQNIKKLGIK